MTWAEKGGMDDDDKVKVVVCKLKDSKYLSENNNAICVLAVSSLSPMCEKGAYRRLGHFF